MTMLRTIAVYGLAMTAIFVLMIGMSGCAPIAKCVFDRSQLGCQ